MTTLYRYKQQVPVLLPTITLCNNVRYIILPVLQYFCDFIHIYKYQDAIDFANPRSRSDQTGPIKKSPVSSTQVLFMLLNKPSHYSRINEIANGSSDSELPGLLFLNHFFKQIISSVFQTKTRCYFDTYLNDTVRARSRGRPLAGCRKCNKGLALDSGSYCIISGSRHDESPNCLPCRNLIIISCLGKRLVLTVAILRAVSLFRIRVDDSPTVLCCHL